MERFKPIMSIIILDVSGLNTLIKSQSWSDWLKTSGSNYVTYKKIMLNAERQMG